MQNNVIKFTLEEDYFLKLAEFQLATNNLAEALDGNELVLIDKINGLIPPRLKALIELDTLLHHKREEYPKIHSIIQSFEQALARHPHDLPSYKPMSVELERNNNLNALDWKTLQDECYIEIVDPIKKIKDVIVRAFDTTNDFNMGMNLDIKIALPEDIDGIIQNHLAEAQRQRILSVTDNQDIVDRDKYLTIRTIILRALGIIR